jgi:4'-phosphopantetheinyl transferase
MVDVLPEHSLSVEASRWVIGELDVTLWSIDSATIETEAALENFSAEEKSRAESYRFPADRRRYISSHMYLRRQLAARLGCAASQVEFGASVGGKPCLGGRWADAPWCFSLSRSAGLAAVAISHAREVGVDIEAVRPIPNIDDLAQRCMSDSELAEYRAGPPDRALGGFFQLWTCKEAVLKAAGFGLRRDPHSIHVGFAVDHAPSLIDIGDIRWRILTAEPVDGYRAAVAIEAQ